MSERDFHHRLIAGETGAWTLPLRALLRTAESLYAFGVARRNARFDRNEGVTRVPVPVISVGNITVGGTGKTPIVLDLLHRLRGLGMTPGVVSRGYGGSGDMNDEARLVHRRFPDAIVVCEPDRVRGAWRAMDQGATAVILDDGFQHRRLARDLDIVAVDVTRPFGYGHLLPRGLLREPIDALRRADVIVLTRCEQATETAIATVEDRVHCVAPRAALLKCRHAVTSVDGLDGSPAAADPRGKRVILFAGVARPECVLETVRSLGANVVCTHWWPDHHAFTERDLRRLIDVARSASVDGFATTEKDAAKLIDLPSASTIPILIPRIDVDFLGDGGTMLQAILEQRIPHRSPATI